MEEGKQDVFREAANKLTTALHSDGPECLKDAKAIRSARYTSTVYVHVISRGKRLGLFGTRVMT